MNDTARSLEEEWAAVEAVLYGPRVPKKGEAITAAIRRFGLAVLEEAVEVAADGVSEISQDAPSVVDYVLSGLKERIEALGQGGNDMDMEAVAKPAWEPIQPHPGSDEAIEQGCTCPVLDNGHGRGYMGGPEFVIVEGCPLHDIGKDEPGENK